MQQDFKPLKTNPLVVILDPFFRAFCCGLSPFSCCSKYKNHHRTIEKVEEKFVRELDAKIMLKKIRDSHDLLKNMIENDYLEFLQYHRERVVDLDESSDSEVEDVSDEETKDNDAYKDLTMKEQMRLAIIRGM